MFKSFFLKALRLIVLILVFVQINFNTALAQEIQSTKDMNSVPSTIPQEEVQMPTNSETTAEEEITATPNQQEETSNLSDANRPQDPYSNYYKSMKEFNMEVYGENQPTIDN